MHVWVRIALLTTYKGLDLQQSKKHFAKNGENKYVKMTR